MNLFEVQILAIGFGLGSCVTSIVQLVMRLNRIRRNRQEQLHEMRGRRGDYERIQH